MPGSGTTRPTIFDVARVSGVSHATVSRVVNGRGNVQDETRQRVEAAMRDLGYVANVSARALASGRTHVIGLLTQEVDDVLFTSVLRGVDEQATAQGYDVLLCTTHARRGTEGEYTARLSRGMVDGLLILMPRGLPDWVQRLHADGFPLVLIDHDEDAPGYDVVTAANRAGARDAVRYLIGLGHRRIGLITGREDVGASRSRLAGYQDAMSAADLDVRSEDVLTGDFTESRGRLAAIEMLSRPDRPTAILASSDLTAFGVMGAAAELGVPVPGDLSVVGFDDIPAAARVRPALTTIRHPARAMGRTAVSRLLRRLADPAVVPDTFALDTELIVRASAAASPI